ncbi:hypothetical protein HK102_005406, partial [Quaeritorhiza haematococci]
MSSSGTLALGSTSSAKVSRGFWNASCQELSKKLWLPTKTDCVALASTSSSPWSTRSVVGSWFKTTLFEPLRKSSPRTSLQSSTSNASTVSGATAAPSNPSSSPSGPTEPKPKTKLKAKMKTNQQSKRKLCSATDCDELIHLTTNGYLCEAHYDPEATQCQAVSMTGRKKGQQCSYASTTQVQLLCQWFGVAREYYNATIEYLVKEKARACFQDVRPVIKDRLDNAFAKAYRLQVPDKIRQGAIQDACRAMNNAKLKYQQDQVFSRLRFRTRRAPSQSIYIDKSAIKVKATLWSFIPGSPRMTQRFGQQSTSKSQERPKARIEATYDEYDKVRGKHDRLKKRLKHTWRKQRARLKTRLKTLRKHYLHCNTKITRIVDDLHWKTAKFLCENFQSILIPKYETKRLQSKLHSRANRYMTRLSHYRFRERLLHKGKQYGTDIRITNEAFTTITCTNCGFLNG